MNLQGLYDEYIKYLEDRTFIMDMVNNLLNDAVCYDIIINRSCITLCIEGFINSNFLKGLEEELGGKVAEIRPVSSQSFHVVISMC